MSNLKAGAITLGGIGAMLVISLGTIPMTLTVGLLGVSVCGVIGLCIKGDKNA